MSVADWPLDLKVIRMYKDRLCNSRTQTRHVEERKVLLVFNLCSLMSFLLFKFNKEKTSCRKIIHVLHPSLIMEVFSSITKWEIDSKGGASVCRTKKWTSLSPRYNSGNMNVVQTADLLPGRDAQQLGFKEDIQLPLTDVNVSSCVCVWVWSWGGKKSSVLESEPRNCVSLKHRMTTRHRTTHLRRTWTPAAPTTTWRTPPRTATVNRAAARTTSANGLLSTGLLILVAMATSRRSKPCCQAQREMIHKTEVRKQERSSEVERKLSQIDVFLCSGVKAYDEHLLILMCYTDLPSTDSLKREKIKNTNTNMQM